jgi:hypothetical protein
VPSSLSHNTSLAAADAGASGHYFALRHANILRNVRATRHPVTVTLPNGHRISSTHVGESPDWAHPHELSTCSATLTWPTTHCSLSAKFAIPATLKLYTMLTQCVFEPFIRNAFRWSALATVLMVYISSMCHTTLPSHHAQRGMTLTYLRRLTWLLLSFTMSLMRN